MFSHSTNPGLFTQTILSPDWGPGMCWLLGLVVAGVGMKPSLRNTGPGGDEGGDSPAVEHVP